MSQNIFTPNELRQFDRLTKKLSSDNQMIRLNARFAVRDFIVKHGEAKCEAMFSVLKRRDKRRKEHENS